MGSGMATIQLKKMKNPIILAGAASVASEIASTVIIAVIVAAVLVAIIKRMRMTPEEKAAEDAMYAERATLKKTRQEAEAAKYAEHAVLEKAQREAVTAQAPVASTPETPGLTIFGYLFCVLGSCVLLFFVLLFDSTVAVPTGRDVNNIGLLNTRLVGVIIGSMFFTCGVICHAAQVVAAEFGRKQKLSNARGDFSGPER